MKKMILMGCLWMFAIASYSQENGRVKSGTPLRWGMNGSLEVMEGDLAVYYGNNDTNTINRRNSIPISSPTGNLHVTRFASVQAVCDERSVLLNWVATQQNSVDRYEMEQSINGHNWTNIGTVPANRSDLGEASYSFNYTKNADNLLFRIAAISTTGERAYTSIIESPCSNAAYLAVTPNPVYSTATIKLGSPVASKIKLILVNSSGVVVQSSNRSLMAGLNQVPLNMSGLTKGYYILYIQRMDGKQDALNIVKQ